MGQGHAPRGSNQQLDAQALFQRIQPAPDDGGRNPLGLGRRRHAAMLNHRHKGFYLFEFVHNIRRFMGWRGGVNLGFNTFYISVVHEFAQSITTKEDI